ncbi:MAG: hypothetical protein OXF88_18245 [Rhodobacteraceae bacterium]|nr:hypothetical protein [Paracoccaceae bacterium]MCY4140756.1 hypothetical protein [Paracoccaceae bacterium]
MNESNGRLFANVVFRRMVFVALAVFTIMLYLLPFGIFRQALSLPDLVYCCVICVVIREPRAAPFWIIVPVMLIGDVFHMRPLGLWTLIVVCVAEAFRIAHVFFQNHGFVIAWIAAVIGYLVALGIQQIALILLFVPTPPLGQLFTMFVLTGVAYPLVSLVWAGLLGNRKPHRANTDRARVR